MSRCQRRSRSFVSPTTEPLVVVVFAPMRTPRILQPKHPSTSVGWTSLCFNVSPIACCSQVRFFLGGKRMDVAAMVNLSDVIHICRVSFNELSVGQFKNIAASWPAGQIRKDAFTASVVKQNERVGWWTKRCHCLRIARTRHPNDDGSLLPVVEKGFLSPFATTLVKHKAPSDANRRGPVFPCRKS